MVPSSRPGVSIATFTWFFSGGEKTLRVHRMPMPQNCRFSSAVTNALTTGAFSGIRKKHLKAKSEQVPPRHTPTGGLGAAAGVTL